MHPWRLLLIPLILASQAAGGAEVTTPAPDFSTAFAKLAALGVPALDSQAKWSAAPDSGPSDYQLRELTKSLKGNAWLLPSADGKSRILPMGGLEIIETDPNQKRGTGGGILSRALGGTPGPNHPPTTFPDPTRDVQALISAIAKQAAKIREDEYSRYARNSGTGGLLLFATQLHQAGHPELANQLALSVFSLFPSREAAVDAAIDQIAGHVYQKATGGFFKTGDWTAYHRSLAHLIARFPRGWEARDAVRMFLPQLEKQAAGDKAPDPELPNIPIDPQALELVRQLTEMAPKNPEQSETQTADIPPELRYQLQMMGGMGEYYGRSSIPSSLWLIEEPPTGDDDNSTLVRLTHLKLAALPALAALATDPFLTQIPNPQSSHSNYYGSDESGDERTLRTYASLNRPASRGELAKTLLVATLPDAQDDLDETDPETLRDLALAFWKEHKNATTVELAAVFLRDGSRSQSSQAASILSASKDPIAHQVFETHVLASEEAIASFQQVQGYLSTRRAKAKPFLDAYAKLVRSQTPEGSGDDDQGFNESSWMIKQAGGVDKILKQLDALVSTQSPRAFAVQIAKGKPEEAEAAIKSLTVLLADASPTKHLFALLEGANAAADASTRAHFLGATFSIHRNAPEGDENTPPPDRDVSEPEAKVWRKLVADTRELPAELNRFQQAGKSTVAELAAFAFEYSVSPLAYSQATQAAPILSKPAATLIHERATARLAGQPMPPLPDASRVSPERLAGIIAQTGEKNPAEIHPYLITLTPDERAAWLAWSREPGAIAMPESVRQLRFLVIGRQQGNPLGYADSKDAGGIDIGFALTPATLKQQVESLAADVSRHSRTVIHLQNAAFGPGLEVLAISIPLPAKENEDASDDISGRHRMHRTPDRIFHHTMRVLDKQAPADAAIVVRLSGEQAAWLVEAGKPAPIEPDNHAALQSALDDLAEATSQQYLRLEIQILSKTDAEKIKQADSDNNDPFAE